MTFRLVLHQTDPPLLDPEGALADLRERVAPHPAELHLTPELGLTGYDLGIRAPEFALDEGEPPPDPGTTDPVLLGFPLRAADGRLHNAAGIAAEGRWLTVQRKVHLPTYGMFDEGRVFAPGRALPRPVEIAGWRVGILICEDLWHPAMSWLSGLAGADLLVCISAAPGRGFSSPDGAVRFESREAWRLMARAAAVQNVCWVAVCNRTGVEGGITYAGGSFVVSPTGALIDEASEFAAESRVVELDRDAVLRARRPFSHLRDADPRWIADALAELRGP